MKSNFSDNLSYKFVALGVAVILWFSMMGRRDTTFIKEFEVQVLLGANVELASTVPQWVKVEVIGPRVALKKFNGMNPIFTVDLSEAKAGRQMVRLDRSGINLPIGARLLSLEPDEFLVVLRDAKAPALPE